ncbi:hypothetical protein MTBBW1_1790060 [Desulfamplus magnetovallimortis]|uniref:Uncharacterized protein n=1 Tax=Desulfamplus magnetovallimortis TaxID=1246637 RepID=A0A1W1HAL0_9BACT|nr:hypothetical protein [Desulfamplus magnetovallimortis]SLM29435.1 hypothetical protein MTBBW1_1790060 [Desulfamplus magnetovallimortis]
MNDMSAINIKNILHSLIISITIIMTMALVSCLGGNETFDKTQSSQESEPSREITDEKDFPINRAGDYIYTVSNLYEFSETLNQKAVTVKGNFLGWNGCSGKTKIITRNDWSISDGVNCIFVSGYFPDGLHPRNKNDIGKTVTIKAIVMDIDGYLVLKNLPYQQ